MNPRMDKIWSSVRWFLRGTRSRYVGFVLVPLIVAAVSLFALLAFRDNEAGRFSASTPLPDAFAESGGAAIPQDARVALVIGNASYEVGRLSNPENDARDVAAALEAKGFDVSLVLNESREGLLRALASFQGKIRPGGIALVFYAGHAVEVEGQNWLLPVENRGIRVQSDVPIYSVSAQDMLRKVEEGGARLSVLILDACRDNPLPATSRGSRGLAPVQGGASSLVVYATAQGRTAQDGTGRNSPFTAALLEELDDPTLHVRELFDKVGAKVESATQGTQVPWTSGKSIWPPVYLAGSPPPPVSSPSITGPSAAVLPPQPEPQPTPMAAAIKMATHEAPENAGTSSALPGTNSARPERDPLVLGAIFVGLVWLLIHRLRRHTPVIIGATGEHTLRGSGQDPCTPWHRSSLQPTRLFGLIIVRGALLQTILVLATSFVAVFGLSLALLYATGIIVHLLLAPILMGMVSISLLPRGWVLSMRVGFWTSIGAFAVGFAVLVFIEESDTSQSISFAMTVAAIMGVVMGAFLGSLSWAMVAVGLRIGGWLDSQRAAAGHTAVGADVSSLLNGRIWRPGTLP